MKKLNSIYSNQKCEFINFIISPYLLDKNTKIKLQSCCCVKEPIFVIFSLYSITSLFRHSLISGIHTLKKQTRYKANFPKGRKPKIIFQLIGVCRTTTAAGTPCHGEMRSNHALVSGCVQLRCRAAILINCLDIKLLS